MAERYKQFYQWATWATLDEACSDDPLPLWKRIARRMLPVPKEYREHA